METGYFASLKTRRGGIVHVVDNDMKTLCKSRISKDAVFQWCAHGIYLPYIECNKCKEIALERLESQLVLIKQMKTKKRTR